MTLYLYTSQQAGRTPKAIRTADESRAPATWVFNLSPRQIGWRVNAAVRAVDLSAFDRYYQENNR